jgi:AcrR family transcriptional regulator
MGEAAARGVVWTRARRGGGDTRRPLDQAKIVEAAIAILDAEGADGLSMRRLGASLGITAPTIYWHVGNKEDLLDIAYDEVMAELPEPAAIDGDWREIVRSSLDELRAMTLRHRWYPALYFARPGIGPNSLRFWAGLTEVLGRAGFSGPELDHALCMLTDHVVGTAAIQVSFDNWLAGDPGDIAATRSYVLDAVKQYPAYAANITGYIAITDSETRREARYAFAVEAMLSSLSALADRNRPADAPERE